MSFSPVKRNKEVSARFEEERTRLFTNFWLEENANLSSVTEGAAETPSSVTEGAADTPSSVTEGAAEKPNSDFMEVGEVFECLHGELRNLKWFYVRGCYKDLDTRIEHFYTNFNTLSQNVIITGTPGVGKSTFMLFELAMAKLRKRNVVLQIGTEAVAFLSEPPFVEPSLNDTMRKFLLQEPGTVFMYDPAGEDGLRKVVRAFTIVFASTWEGNFRTLLKAANVKLYMPVWTLEELKHCRKKCYPLISDKTVCERYKKWGGVPRSIFITAENNEERFHTFITSKALDSVVAEMQCVSLPARPYDNHQWLVHISNPDNEYQKCYRHWPSSYVAKEVHKVLVKNKSYAMLSNKPNMLKWEAYEIGVIGEIENEKQQREAESLYTGEKVKIPITKEMLYFTNASVIGTPDPHTLYVPVEPNKRTLDSFKGEWVFQATLADKHDVNKKGLEALHKATNCSDFKICWCIPQVRWNTFRPKTFEESDIKVTHYKLAFH